MKRKTLLLMMILALFSAGAWAQTAYTSYSYDGGTSHYASDQSPAKLVDNQKTSSSKWCVTQFTSYSPIYVEFHSSEPIVPTGYVMTTGGDCSSYTGRNPRSWVIKAKRNSSDSWTTIETQSSNTRLEDVNLQDYTFNLNNSTEYQYFRFEVSAIANTGSGYNVFQLTELQFLVGGAYNMPTGSITTCDGILYDSGGSSGSYSNNEDRTLTIYPETSGCKVQLNFTSFETENSYDKLYIYDGTSTSATQIGTYSGTTSPGTVTATNSSGALTLKFTSDNSVQKAGWAANISCACPTPTEVEIGSSQSTSSYLPTAMYYNYSLSQQIYTPAEIGCTGTINKISFFHNGGNYARSIVIYMKKTTASTLSSYDSNPGTQVYSGSYTFTSGWNTITLNTPFNYDDICKYLMITMDDNTGVYENSHTFATYSTGENRAMQIHSDGTNYDPTSSSYSFTTEQSNNHIKLTMIVDSEYKILHATSNDINMGSFSMNPSGTNCSNDHNYAFETGTSVTLTAFANSGNMFLNWTVDGNTVTGTSTTITMNANHTVMANFTQSYNISASVSPSGAGSVSGTGSFASGAICTLAAMSNSGYCFVNWTENGTEVSTSPSYAFIVSGNRTLVANFISMSTNDITVSGSTTIACGNSTTLTAGGLTGVTYNWYSDAACTNLVQANSATLTTPALTENTTYYVKAVGGTSYMEQETTFSYTGSAQTYNIPTDAEFLKLEVWGAQGGNNSTTGGKGGYSVGMLSNLSGISSLNVYVGQQSTSSSGGWNGGGGMSSFGKGGGGGTDIRLNGNTYYDRIIVAGGGGGAGYSNCYGGYGGGENGGAGADGSASGGGGGTQTSGGSSSSSTYAGLFGSASTSSDHNGGGGGGGWYGGGAGTGGGTDSGAGGGSGYVWTSSTATSAPSGYNVPASYYLTNAETIGGNATMPNPAGGTMTGREGDGYARITAYTLGSCESDAMAVTVTVNPISASDITVSGNSTNCGDIATLTASGVTGVTYYWYSDAACTNLVATGSSFTTPMLYNNTTYYVKAVKEFNIEGTPVSFSYTGSAQSYSIPANASAVKLEVWGAEGGGQRISGNTNSGYGGKGGYSVGTMSVSGNESIQVYVGGIGGYAASGLASGGYNGGGSNYGSDSGEPANGGGGATDIRLNGNTLYHRIIVAGGGGGGGEDSSDQGGYGGGTSGGNGNQYSYPGTQTSATDGGGGVFGIGASSTYDGGAGGGGWYGGGTNGGSQTIPTSNSGTDCGGGSGGSGYVWTSSTASYAPSGYSVSSSYYLTDAQTIAGNATMPNPAGGTMTGREGDGYARITAYITEECESEVKAVTITVNQPAAPTNVTASNVSLTSATVSWDANGESSWQYSIDDGANWTNASTNTVNLSSLTPGQTYTYQVKAIGSGTCESSVASTTFTTLSTYNVTVTANPAAGGTVSINNGTPGTNVTEACDANSNVTLTATANAGYTFVNWTKNGNEVSTDANYSFTVTEAGEYVANFEANLYNLTVAADPTHAGSVTVNPAGTPVSSSETYTVGTGESQKANAPFGKRYTFVEMLYTKDELTAIGASAGSISSIAFKRVNANDLANQIIDVYMKATTESSLSTYISIDNADLVCTSYTLTDQVAGWVTIPLTTPFNWDGESNVLVAVNKTSAPQSPDTYWYNTTDINSILFNNSSEIDPTHLNEYSANDLSCRPNIQFTITPASTTYQYAYGTEVALTATPTANSGYYFYNWTDGSNNTYTDNPLNVTVTEDMAYTAHFVNYKRFVTDGSWNEASNWSPAGVPTASEDVAIEAAATIYNGKIGYANVIRPITHANGSITIKDGGQLVHKNNNENDADRITVTVENDIAGYGAEDINTNKGYEIVSFPTPTEIAANSNAFTNLFPDTPYDFYAFDRNNNAGTSSEPNWLEWVHVNNNSSSFIDLCQGYIYASRDDNTIKYTGKVYSSTAAFGTSFGNDGEITPRFNGWALFGNPHVCNAYVYNNDTEMNYYVLDHKKDYDEFVPFDNSNPIAPMGGVMIRTTDITDDVSYSTTPLGGAKTGILNIDVNRTMDRGTATLDRARVRFGEGRNLEKLQFDTRHTKVYIPEDGNDFSVYYADGAGTIPVNFKAQDNGRYTLDFSTEDVGFNYLHLIDNMNGNDVDLLQTPYYAFDAKSTDFASRFTLVFATGNDNDDTFAFFNNGVWIINNDGDATLQVVDALGRMLSSESISGSTSKAINVAPGVYMLRLINGDKAKVQKIVVKR